MSIDVINIDPGNTLGGLPAYDSTVTGEACIVGANCTTIMQLGKLDVGRAESGFVFKGPLAVA